MKGNNFHTEVQDFTEGEGIILNCKVFKFLAWKVTRRGQCVNAIF